MITYSIQHPQSTWVHSSATSLVTTPHRWLHTVCDNITLLFRIYETKRKQNDLFRCTKHPPPPFKQNRWTVLERFIVKKQPQNNCHWIKWLKNHLALNKGSRTIGRWIKRLQIHHWDVPVPTGDAVLYSADESAVNRHCLWTSSPEQHDIWGLSSDSWRRSRACNCTVVVSSSSLICC